MNSTQKIDHLDIWWHRGEHSAASHLAFDEALVTSVIRPTLRFYQWRGQPWTMGYFQRWCDMPFGGSEPDETIARRWTGGGLVSHRGDFPYTLAVPAEHWLAQMSAAESYRWIHQQLADAICKTIDISAKAQPAQSAASAVACFDAPVHWDVVAKHPDEKSPSKKIAGAAQRRTRGRLLHQGGVILPPAACSLDAAGKWRKALIPLLADTANHQWQPDGALVDRANQLNSGRYRDPKWTTRF